MIGYGMLMVDEIKFWSVPLHRLSRAHDWFIYADEARLAHTRLLAYYMGNHKASSPEDMFQLPSEIEKRRRDLIAGKVPIAEFKTLTKEEVEKWETKSY